MTMHAREAYAARLRHIRAEIARIETELAHHAEMAEDDPEWAMVGDLTRVRDALSEIGVAP